MSAGAAGSIVFTHNRAALISDVDRIAAARWAARELILPEFRTRGRRGWIHTVDAKGAIRSSSTRRDRYAHA